ncbi:MAG TPA: hypothetical protein HA256_01880 [Methanoregulaceae archaeon]|nr:hypothetical protein [Methanoregulaceae archaeon]
MGNNLQITGVPGIGTTTLLVNLARALANFQPAGFITREIRECGARKGFERVSCSGTGRKSSPMLLCSARTGQGSILSILPDLRSSCMKSRFFHAVRSSSSWMRSGKWNAYPQSSEKTIQQILDSDRPFIATIAKSGPPFIDRIRCPRDVLLS